MIKVEAPTLEEAYQKAALALECSISELQCEVVQHPTKGILGFLHKNAIIVATKKITEETSVSSVSKEVKEKDVANEIIATVKDNLLENKKIKVEKDHEIIVKDEIVESFFEEKTEYEDDIEEGVSYDELAKKIEDEIKELFSHGCFDLDVIEVDVIDNRAYIFIDGEDAALLIGKEGYRYNALSYMLFNWLHTKYQLFIKLEIAEFFTSQEKMIKAYIKPVIETIEKTGYAKTRYLDGILVQIALEQLRERFPNKYVAVKTSKDGKKFVVINDFNTKFDG